VLAGGTVFSSISASASRDKVGKIHVTLCNPNPNQAAEVAVDLQEAKAQMISGQVLTAPQMNAHNTFKNPDSNQAGAILCVQNDGPWLFCHAARKVCCRAGSGIIIPPGQTAASAILLGQPNVMLLHTNPNNS
jgi:hypothetical protein